LNINSIVAVLNEQNDYAKANNYWRWLKRKFVTEQHQLVSDTHGFKFLAPDGKRRLADALDGEGVIELAKNFPNTKAMKFLDWFLYSDNTIDGQSKKKGVRSV
jgi:cell filamentation protein